MGKLALQLERKTTIRDLLPAHNKVVQQFEETVTTFEMVDRVVLVLQFEPENLEQAQIFAEIFVEETLDDPRFEAYLVWLKANLFDDAVRTDWYEYLRYITRLLTPTQLADLLNRLGAEGIEAQIAENRRELETGLAAKLLIEKDPLNLLEFAGTYRNEITGNYQLRFTDGFLVSKQQDMLLVMGKPTQSPEDVDFSKEMDAFLAEKIDLAKSVFAEEEGVDPEELFEVGITGPHPISAHENRIIQDDIVDMFLSSFAMVLLLFVIAYGRPFALLYVGIPLLSAEVWTMGIGYLLFGRLNLLTAAFSAVIVGLGIDYAIHIFSRYLDERQHGHNALDAMRTALSQTGMGTLVGGVTTALAFTAMTVSNFSGLREFGIIAAVGILLCLLHMFIMLPCMLFLRERFRASKEVAPPQRDFHVDTLVRTCLNFRKPALVLFTILTAWMLWEAAALRFTTDIRSVRARSNPGLVLQNQVTQKVGGSLRSLTFVLSAPSEEVLYQRHDQLLPVLDEMVAEGDVVRYDSLLEVLQKPAKQLENMALIEQSGITATGLKEDFEAALQRNDTRYTKDYQNYIQHLAEGLDLEKPTTLRELVELESNFIRPFLDWDDGIYRAVIHVYPRMGLWQKDNTRTLVSEILASFDDLDEDALYVTGIQTISEELKRLVKESFEVASLLSVILVFAILYFHFRRWSLVFLTLVPLLCAVIWMLGTMHLLGIDITFINFVATPIIIGIGIDDGVHIVEKYLHRGKEELDSLIARCGKAVTLTSITTILGFSSLFLADYAGFQSLGLCSILGVFYCWLGSVVLLPILLTQFNVKFIRADVPE